jgi:putative ABC transport system permease protein
MALIEKGQLTIDHSPLTTNFRVMIKNYFKSSWRNLIKNKAQSVINIAGLSVGMSAALLIGLWMWDELSFDKYHEN